MVVVGTIVRGANGRAITSRMPLAEAAFLAFVVAGLIEEFGKFVIVRLSLFESPYFDEPLRGMIYASAVALGVASIENVDERAPGVDGREFSEGRQSTTTRRGERQRGMTLADSAAPLSGVGPRWSRAQATATRSRLRGPPGVDQWPNKRAMFNVGGRDSPSSRRSRATLRISTGAQSVASVARAAAEWASSWGRVWMCGAWGCIARSLVRGLVGCVCGS